MLPLFLDIGSNIGCYTVAVAKKHPTHQVGKKCSLNMSPFKIIAVDADAENLAYVKRSLEENLLWREGHVRLIHNAVR